MLDGDIIVSKVSIHDNLTNMLTKPLLVTKFEQLLELGWCLLMSFSLLGFLWKRPRLYFEDWSLFIPLEFMSRWRLLELMP